MNNQWRDNANLMVIWADGSYDSSRKCDMCRGINCPTPLHEDHYKEVGQAQFEIEDANASTSDLEMTRGYWDWMHTNQPHGSFHDHDGDLVTPESAFANPDSLAETPARSSGITEQQTQWLEEARQLLTDKQREVWDLVMREQMPQVIVAAQLKIDASQVVRRLDRAKERIEEYLRSKTDNDNPA